MPLLCTAITGQQPAVATGADRSAVAGRQDRRTQISRIASERAPTLDAQFDEPCWQRVAPIGELVEVEPVEGRLPAHRTVIRLIHDADNIYMALQCFDPQPDTIRASQRQRDANLDPDDRVEWLFDTFDNDRLAYWFQIGAGGSRGDALIAQGGNSFNKSWDTIWDGTSRITAEGWQAEVAIPFRSIAQTEGGGTWGFNIRRLHRTANAEYRWNSPLQSQRFFWVAEAGVLTGLGKTNQGLGLDFVPYAALQTRRTRSVDPDFDVDPDLGGEIFYRITPQLIVSTTFFTDFAQTENDGRQINTNRFPLFFPERRDFFLADANRFEFGSGNRSLLPFFSRRVGLASGQRVPILAGAKLTGEAGPWSMGILSVQTDDAEGLETGGNLSVARVNYAVAGETQIGGIVTHGRPTSSGDNTVVGIDAYHREPDFIGDTDLRLWGSALMSQTSGAGGDGSAWELRARGQGSEWSWGGRSTWITSDFNPELGFLRRRGIKQQTLDLGYTRRINQPWIRRWEAGVSANWVLSEGNDTLDLEFEVDELGVSTNEGDSISIFGERRFERISAPFTLFDGQATIQAGDYWTSRAGLRIGSGEGRPFSASASVSTGNYFDGSRVRTSVEADWRTGPLLILGAEVSNNFIELPTADVSTVVVEGRVDFHFSPWASWLNLVQFDNESDLLGVQSRLRWILRPGSDLFVVASGGWLRQDGSLIPEDQDLTLKIAHTIRF